MSTDVLVLTDPTCLEHRSPPGFPEVPARIAGILTRLEERGRRVVAARERDDVDEAIVAVHPEAYLARLDAAVARGDALLDSADNPLSPATAAATRAAVAAGLDAADRVFAGTAGAVFAAVRPPGHHAERDRAMGFCYANTAAIVAEYARRVHACERVAVFDFDVHHGNGTQHLFEDRSDVHYSSVHQYPFYPGTGAAGETGRGPGEGTTVNVPLPAGCGDREYREALEGRILPALAEFRPDLLVVSAGFDAWRGDPLGGMRVSEAAFRAWGESLAELADRVCGGRWLSLLEGGYDLEALPRLVDGYLSGAVGETFSEDPDSTRD